MVNLSPGLLAPEGPGAFFSHFGLAASVQCLAMEHARCRATLGWIVSFSNINREHQMGTAPQTCKENYFILLSFLNTYVLCKQCEHCIQHFNMQFIQSMHGINVPMPLPSCQAGVDLGDIIYLDEIG